MATLADIGVSALINLGVAIACLIAFALLRIQPMNKKVYFPKWEINRKRGKGPKYNKKEGNYLKSYLTFLNWMPQALQMKEDDLIHHAGLDSAVFLRIYTLGLKIFGPTAIVVVLFLIPVNASDATLFFLSNDLVVSEIDNFSISNVTPKSTKFFVHIGMQYLFTFWTCFWLYKEYGRVASMRLNFLSSRQHRPEQFTVLVRNIPLDPLKSISEKLEEFFMKNYPDHYLHHKVVYDVKSLAKPVKKRRRLQDWVEYYRMDFHQYATRRSGFLGLWGKRVPCTEFYAEKCKKMDEKLDEMRSKIMNDPKCMTPAAFVSFRSRWGAAVCAQTQNSKNPIQWHTRWAPEPRDICWKNVPLSFLSMSFRRLLMTILLFALIFFYMIPIAFVQSLANLEGLEKVAPFLRPFIEWKVIKSFLQGFVPGLTLKIFLLVLPDILLFMSKIEGHVALSVIERTAAAKYYYFILINIFFGSIIAGTAFQQLNAFLHQSASQIPRNVGVSIPMKATFFITYIMVDGWSAIALEILRLKPFLVYHLLKMFAKTEKDKRNAMYPGGVNFYRTLSTLQLYFLLGSVYAVVTPILLPFILVFFAFAYLVYRHQVINVYDQQYESAGAFWPHVHGRIIASLVLSQLLLMGLLSTKKAAKSTPLLILLPFLTFAFHKYCKSRFEPAFRTYPLEEAMEKDKQDGGANSKTLNEDTYLNPIFYPFEEGRLSEV
ncbi:unnamed protein product [Cuscuta campestris]|uniref:CSC1/OSCA1-like 7TM region domain-containing protein n=1 Tax=Cuscuta campestris TaxID=132261 RepID=A0A484L3L6_9ASTE|nr:unnamed protein product [Cuscuta campestris]